MCLAAIGQLIYWVSNKWKQEIVNDKEIRFVGLQRTGNHAIINWIYLQCKEPRCYLNSVRPQKNPFYTFQRKGTFREFHQDFLSKSSLYAEKIGLFKKKNLLLYSYEDEFLDDVACDSFERNRQKWLGRSRERYDMLLLRDPYNLFASRLKKEDEISVNKYSLRIEKQRKSLVAIWKQYAIEFLDETSFLKHDKVCVNYNKWCSDREYRKDIAARLGLEFSDAGIEQVLHIGGGSSFDRTEFNNMASEMKVMERWRHYIDDNDYRQIFKDTELVELSERIFGIIPGTDVLHDN